MNNFSTKLLFICTFAAFGLLTGCGSGGPADPIPHYILTDLGTLGGSWTRALALNNSGEVVGMSFLSGDLQSRPFIWRPDKPNAATGHMTAIEAPGSSFGEADDINDSGTVVGMTVDSSNSMSAFAWNGETFTNLPPLSGQQSWAFGINTSGDVVGMEFTTALMLPNPLVWRAGVPHPLELPTGFQYGIASSINDDGAVVGTAQSGPDSGPQNMLWFPNSAQVLDIVGTGTIPQQALPYSYEPRIGNDGVTVGTAYSVPGMNRGFTLSPALLLQILPANESQSASFHARNTSGLIVGEYAGRASAFLAGRIVDLSTRTTLPRSSSLARANDINEAGQIVGEAFLNGLPHGFLLTPKK